jgi:hypothetical protein
MPAPVTEKGAIIIARECCIPNPFSNRPSRSFKAPGNQALVIHYNGEDASGALINPELFSV